MKKVLSLVLIVALCVSLSACGSKEESKKEAPKVKYLKLVEMKSPMGNYNEKQLKDVYGVKDTSEISSFLLNPNGTGALGERESDPVLIEWVEKDGVTTIKSVDDGKELAKFKRKGKKYIAEESELFKSEENGKAKDENEKFQMVFVEVDKVPAVLAKNPIYLLNVNYNLDKTEEMATFMAEGMYAMDGNTVYGLFYKDNTQALASKEIKKVDNYYRGKEVTYLKEKINPYYITIAGDNVYFIGKEVKNEEKSKLYRVPKKGGDVKVIYDKNCNYLSVVKDRLYFTDENYNYVSTDLEGNNKTAIIDKECYYAFPVDDDWIVFQDDKDNESLHLFYMPTAYDVALNHKKSHAPVIDGKYLYYTVNVGEDEYHMNRMDLSKWDSKKKSFKNEASNHNISSNFFITDKDIFFGHYNGVDGIDKSQWKKLGMDKYDKNASGGDYKYLSKNYNIYWNRDDKGLVSDIMFGKPELGTGHNSIK